MYISRTSRARINEQQIGAAELQLQSELSYALLKLCYQFLKSNPLDASIAIATLHSVTTELTRLEVTPKLKQDEYLHGRINDN